MKSQLNSMLIVIPFDLPLEHTADYAHQTAKLLSERHVVVCFLYKEAKSIKEYILSKKKEIFWKKHDKQLLYYPLYIIPFRRLPVVERANQLLSIFFFRIGLQRRTKNISFSRKLLWIFDPESFSFMRHVGSSYEILYDCVDYHTQRSAQAEYELLRTCSYCFVNSRVLYDTHSRIRSDVVLVPQGFDEAWRKKNRLHKSQKAPIIGYVGGINNRLDYSLLFDLIRVTPQYQYEFVGPIQIHDASSFLSSTLPAIERVFSLPNVRHISEVTKPELAQTLSRFTVGIIPYKTDMLFNRFCYPAKIFEYFYAGIPVVSTDIIELRRFPSYVSIGLTSSDWKQAMQHLVSHPWKKAVEQRKLARANSWKRKISAIFRIIESDRQKKRQIPRAIL